MFGLSKIVHLADFEKPWKIHWFNNIIDFFQSFFVFIITEKSSGQLMKKYSALYRSSLLH